MYLVQRNSQEGASVLGKGIGFISNITTMATDKDRVRVTASLFERILGRHVNTQTRCVTLMM